MSSPSDDVNEMPNHQLTDRAIEAFFAGSSDPGWEHDESLAALADDMAMVMTAPAPVANHALRQLFWETPQVHETTRAAAAARNMPVAPIGDNRPVGGFRGRLRLIAAAALGTGLALSGVGVAGATGSLPDRAQRVVASVVEAISPFEFPHPDGHSPAPSGGVAGSTGDGTGDQAPTPGRQPAVVTPGPSSNDPSAPSSGPPPAPATGPGSRGLDRAGQTPAGQSVPPSVPGPGTPSNLSPGNSGNPPPSGLDTARQTPAADAVPASVPGPSRRPVP